MKLLLALPAAALAAACSTTPLPVGTPASPASASAPQTATPAAGPAPAAVARSAPAAQATEAPLQAFERTRSQLDSQSVYFDFDASTIRPDETRIVAAHANLATSYPRDHIVLQGNCDERGGREYNLALGQRRADEVKERLVLLGVPATRIETISFGKEKPRGMCHEERCWAENRRADFVDSWK